VVGQTDAEIAADPQLQANLERLVARGVTLVRVEESSRVCVDCGSPVNGDADYCNICNRVAQAIR